MDPLRKLLIEDEAERLQVYDCGTGKPLRQGDIIVGHPTIGVGRNLAGNGISRDESRLMLDNDIAHCTAAARRYEWFDALDEVRQAVVICMIFQMGANGFHAFPMTRRYIAGRRYFQASKEMLDSIWARHDSPNRAKRLSQMMATGRWP